jgi:transposase InsO family protein
MRERGIAGITRRRRRSLTKQDTAVAPAPDLIGRDFTADAPRQRFVGDITYLPTQEGWLYLATVIDLYSREVIGHAMAEHMRAEPVLRRGHSRHQPRPEQLRRRVSLRSRHPGTSRPGSAARSTPRASVRRWAVWARATTTRSRSRSSPPSKPRSKPRSGASRDDARGAVFAYLGHYNHDRLHSTLDYRTPRETRISYRQDMALLV